MKIRRAISFALVGLPVAAFIAWSTHEKAELGVGLLHHIRTNGFDSSAIVGIVVTTILTIAYYVGRDKSGDKDDS